MKNITIVSKGLTTALVFKEQLHTLLGHRANIVLYAQDHFIPATIKGDVTLLTTRQLLPKVKPFIEDLGTVVVARRSVNYHEVSKLFSIPGGTDVLLVNDMESTTHETIAMLQMLNIDHINYHPYYPGIAEYPKLEVAVTPGENALVPDCVTEVHDIQSRPIDITTLVDILTRIGLIDLYADMLSAHHVHDIIELVRNNTQIIKRDARLQSQLQGIINAVHDGIVGTDEEGRVSVYNAVAETLFGQPANAVLNRHLDSCDTLSLLLDEKSRSESEVFRTLHGRHVLLNVTEIAYAKGRFGKVYTLKDVSEIRRLEENARLKLKGENKLARYTFADLVGTSPSMTDCVRTAKRMAKSEATILLEGESGTGKELLAQSIHNASIRKNGPFIAVNLAAMPETLLESELFGYEPGAFTGATRTGSMGLFEAAHKGTIFLDEIGDAPLSFQVKLLRVLQEREIKKIGSTRMMPIDVRVIAATNRNLKELTHQGRFRIDLYYRLRVLPLTLSPLRERGDDMAQLAASFYHKFVGKPAGEVFRHVMPFMRRYDWPGNIRELQNLVEYLVNVCPDHPPTLAMLPQEIREQALHKGESDVAFVYDTILRAQSENSPLGRRTLARITNLPESRIRAILNELAGAGKIHIGRGRQGLSVLRMDTEKQ